MGFLALWLGQQGLVLTGNLNRARGKGQELSNPLGSILIHETASVFHFAVHPIKGESPPETRTRRGRVSLSVENRILPWVDNGDTGLCVLLYYASSLINWSHNSVYTEETFC